jgi:predicted transcriptional regulator YheO
MKPKIYIGSTQESIQVAEAIHSNLEEVAECTVWKQGIFTLSENALYSLVGSLDRFDFAILVLTGEDFLESRGSKYQAPRDNIIFELGLFTARIGLTRTFVVRDKSVKAKIPTDLHGITYTDFEIHSDKNYSASLGPSCYKIKNVIASLGLKQNTIEELRHQVNKLQKELSEVREEIPGKRLYQHRGYYPIDIEQSSNIPKLNREKFLAAINYFLYDEYDRLAVTDLVYLREDNIDAFGDILKNEDFPQYLQLIEKYELELFVRNLDSENKYLFSNLKKIIHDIGDTLKDCCIEILLHNIRNPIRSIVALRNTEEISKRKKYDPSTRFVVQFVKDQGRKFNQGINEGSKISYPKQFNKTKQVKATTIPIQHPRYGLIAILCINIDKERIEKFTEQERATLIDNYIKTVGETPDYEKEDWGVK